MIPAINAVILAISGSLAASVVVKVTVTTALGLIVAWLAHRSRAAVRHAVLAATFVAALLLPIASVVMPPIHVGVPVAVEDRASALPPIVNLEDQTPTVEVAGDPPISVPQSSRYPLSNLLLAGWFAGGAIFLLPLVIGLWQIRLVRRSALPWHYGQSLAKKFALDAGIRRRVDVLLHETVPGPMTCGVVHPTIVLPRDAENWNEEDLSRAFVHELEHVRRGDSVSRFLAWGACAVYWFHPLVWIAWRRLVLEAERSCDDAVLKRSEATAYADQLVGLAKRLTAVQRSPLVAMANRADLATRVRAVLDVRQRRGRAGAFSLALAATSAMVLVISMSSLVLVARPQAAPTPSVKSADPKAPSEPSRREPDAPRLVAQALAPARPAPAPEANLRFEVASIRRVEVPPAANGGVPVFFPTGGIGTSSPLRITYRGTWLFSLISEAFGVRADQITGPASVKNDRFDIVANIPEGATKEQFKVMLGNLLRDRFNLLFHIESKIHPVYVLRVAKNGPKFKETARVIDDATPGKAGAPDANGFPVLSPNFQGMVAIPTPGEIFVAAQDVPIGDLPRSLELKAGRPIFDETGLTGRYDFKLHYEYIRRGPVTDASTAPSVFTAVEEQLGLKLESANRPIDQFIIDSIDLEPTEN